MKRFLYETAVVATAACAVLWFKTTGQQARATDVWQDAMSELDDGIARERGL